MKTKKGIVVEADKNKAVILLPGGEYRKVRTGGNYLEEGDLYEYNSTPVVRYAVAAVLLLAIIVGGIDYNSVKAYASLGTDLELGINRWGRVVSVQAKSIEGQQILDNVQVKNDKLEIAVEKITRQAMKEENKNPQEIRQNLKTKVNAKDNQKLEENIKKNVNKGLDKAIPNEKVKINKGKGNGHNQNEQQQVINDLQVNTEQTLDEENDNSEPQEILSEENDDKQEIEKEEKKLEHSEKKDEQNEKQKSSQNSKNENSQSNSKNKNNEE
ncbi:MAG: hypothetical protein H6Q64_1638 [Firmicutes bacterium]|nr:hypothetical protein [Bacillota bacterium]